ncbi:MAG: hypothetical protein IJ295_02105 [Clostridia bacterium]|nr:hypothetical protein [Clostridia bacterium]
MPSGSRSGGHFGGGSRSFSSGHFGGGRSHSSGHFAGRSGSTRSYIPSFRWRPHTTVIFGRPVYLGAGRARATSLLTIFISIAVIIAAFMGISWWQAEDSLNNFCDEFRYYQEMAQYADAHPEYQIDATVDKPVEHGDTGIYCIEYTFDGFYEGYSFCVYDKATADRLYADGVIRLALDSVKTNISSDTDSVPLDFMYAELTDDADYLDFLSERDGARTGTAIAASIAGALIVISFLVSATAKKATKEQIAESEQAKNGTQTEKQTTTNGAWRCEYCNTLNDSAKNSCDGCGAGRQN